MSLVQTPSETFPREILNHILDYAPKQTLLNASLVNKEWNEISNDDALWTKDGIFKTWYGSKTSKPHHYKQFVSNTKKQTAQYVDKDTQRTISQRRQGEVFYILMLVLACLCPPIAACITWSKFEDEDDDTTGIVITYGCFIMVFIGSLVFWIPGIICACFMVCTVWAKHE